MTSQHTQASTRRQGTPLSRAMRPINHVVERFIPSSLVFSILLTLTCGSSTGPDRHLAR